VNFRIEPAGLPIQLERLPAFAPELNPVEYLFGYAKQREFAKLCVQTIAELRRYASRRLKPMQHRPSLVRIFWQQAELGLCPSSCAKRGSWPRSCDQAAWRRACFFCSVSRVMLR
jgi:hypothetical protein